MTLPDPYADNPAARRARTRRNWAIAVGLVLFVLLVFAVTLAKLGANVATRPI